MLHRAALAGCAAALLAASSACDALSNALSYDYVFDEQVVIQSIPPATTQTVPDVACTPGASDPCAIPGLPPGSPAVACDGAEGRCAATYVLAMPVPVDLRQARSPVPDEVLRFGIDRVTIHRVAYGVLENTLTTATPELEVFVGPESAQATTDPGVVKLGALAPIPAMSKDCADTPNTADPRAKSVPVCDLQLTSEGQTALAERVKSFKTAPFKLFAAATLRAEAGSPMPAGTIQLFLRPTVRFSLLR